MLSRRETEKFLETYFDECMAYWTAALHDRDRALKRAIFDVELIDRNQKGALLDLATKEEFIRNKQNKK